MLENEGFKQFFFQMNYSQSEIKYWKKTCFCTIFCLGAPKISLTLGALRGRALPHGYPRSVDLDFKATISRNRDVRKEPPSPRFEIYRLNAKNERAPWNTSNKKFHAFQGFQDDFLMRSPNISLTGKYGLWFGKFHHSTCRAQISKEIHGFSMSINMFNQY